MPEAFAVIKGVLKAVFLLGWVSGGEEELCFSWALLIDFAIVWSDRIQTLRHSFCCLVFSVEPGPNPFSSLPFRFNGCNFVDGPYSTFA